MQRAVVHLDESLDGISQREAFYDGGRFECARFEARRELVEDSRAGHGVIGARVHAEEAEAPVIKIEQIETDAAIADGSNVHLAAELAERSE